MTISIIVAYAQDRVIGKDNKLLWYLPEDLRFFKEMTEGKVVIMGRKTYESIPEKFRPLPKRTTYILTRDKDYTVDHESVRVFTDAGKCLMMASLASSGREVMVAGGEQIYRLLLPYADTIYATVLNDTYDGDTFFPDIDMRKWKLHSEHGLTTPQLELFYTRRIYKRKGVPKDA